MRRDRARLGTGLIHHLSPGIDDFAHQHRFYVHSVIGNRSVSVYQFHKIDVAGTKGQRRGLVQRRLYAHVVCGLHNIGDTHFLSQLDSNRIDALRKGGTQRYVGIREMSVGVMGLPYLGSIALAVIHLHPYIGILARIGGGQSLLHGGGINKELEG